MASLQVMDMWSQEFGRDTRTPGEGLLGKEHLFQPLTVSAVFLLLEPSPEGKTAGYLLDIKVTKNIENLKRKYLLKFKKKGKEKMEKLTDIIVYKLLVWEKKSN